MPIRGLSTSNCRFGRYLGGSGLFPIFMKKPVTFVIPLLALFAFSAPAQAMMPAPLANPDRPATTPRMDSGSASVATASDAKICPTLRRWAGKGNSAPGLRVRSLDSGKTICSLNSTSKRSLASNTKLFTTSTSLAKFGTDHHFRTRLYADGKIRDGVLKGSLYLKGGGDPSLGTSDFLDTYFGGDGADIEKLARLAKRAGIKRVTGRLYGDDTIFDSKRGVPDSGYATSSYIGPLSGLEINAGFTSATLSYFSSDPARTAAKKLVKLMRGKGIRIQKQISLRKTPASAERNLLGRVLSPNMTWTARTTNLYSNNFFAEMLLKNLGAEYRGLGTTHRGTTVVERYVKKLGSWIDQKDGSGLTFGNRSTPSDVVKLLSKVRKKDFGPALIDSLPTAGVDGTLDDRMRGSAAQGNCHAKTGTLTGVSALSGYCFNESGRKFVFSILMNGVSNLDAAHIGQDRIVAAIAGR